MLRKLLIFSALLISTAAPAIAQHYAGGRYVGAPRMSQQEAQIIADYWIRSYLRRSPAPGEDGVLAQRLVREPPGATLAALLSGQEYYNVAGGNAHAYMHRLIEDVGHRQASPYEVQARVQQFAGWNSRTVAASFLNEHPANWWPGPTAAPPRELRYFYGSPGRNYSPYAY